MSKLGVTECAECGRMTDGEAGAVCISCKPQEWKLGGNRGRISYQLGNGKYLAVTATSSGWYKTYRGAAQFMARKGYEVQN